MKGVLSGNLESMIREVQSLKSKARATAAPGKKSIMIALPNMLTINTHLLRRMFEYVSQCAHPDAPYSLMVHTEEEKHFHSYARNLCVKAFLATNADYLFFIDSDVVPPPNALSLASFGKPIIAGSVMCWINGNIMPSIWTRSACEQCRNVKQFEEEGTLIDSRQYKAEGNLLSRWSPFSRKWQPFYTSGSGFMATHQCRCGGTGRDPFVFKVDPKIVEREPFETDSVGAAMLMIERHVIEKMAPYPFHFLFHESEEIFLTEDHYFCTTAKALGFEVWAHPQIVGQHFKLVDLLGVNSALATAYRTGMDGNKDGAIITNVQATPTPSLTAVAE